MINLSLQVQDETQRRCLRETIWVHKNTLSMIEKTLY